ncbi:MAG: hypothetical protein LBU44_00345 [Mediterranea sp.]|jgi:hypothetical protein|nr:hypothetical protein [Mediterranea sp.]
MKRKTFRCWALVAALLLASSAGAQSYKVIEKSDKKAPLWYESAESGYIVASAEAVSMEEARLVCLESIKRQILQSVAENIEFSDSHTIKQTTGNDRITEFLDEYTADGSTKAASIPFIKGISLSKVDGSYWEKRKDKKTNVITYCYAVRYPFPASEHRMLVMEFEKRDKEMEALVSGLENMDTVESVEEINQRINKLRPAMDYFFDKTRQQWVNGVADNYRKLPNSITVKGEVIDNTNHRVALWLNGKKIKTGAMPKLTSNCASKLKVTPEGDDLLITFDNEDCLSGEINAVDVAFRLHGKVLKYTFHFEAAQAGKGKKRTRLGY